MKETIKGGDLSSSLPKGAIEAGRSWVAHHAMKVGDTIDVSVSYGSEEPTTRKMKLGFSEHYGFYLAPIY